ncbi:MAG: autotransporter-associated beta strand repeat-containing protein [Verrucomicrobiota bacterium]
MMPLPKRYQLFLRTVVAAVCGLTGTSTLAVINVTGIVDPVNEAPDFFWTNGGNSTVDGTIGSTTDFGTLTVNGGSRLDLAFGRIQSGGAMTSTATVTGAGSIWDVNRQMIMGESGQTNLLIENGGSVLVGGNLASLGAGAGATSTATITGTGSTWNINDSEVGELVVGADGEGILNINAGGKVTNSRGTLARNSGSVGSATVSGTGSQWENTLELVVGRIGDGTLRIEDGALVTAPNVFIARVGGSTGDVTVNNSQLTATGFVSVGNEGEGTLLVENGGVVSGVDGFVAGRFDAPNPNAVGTVTVTGDGSQWNNSGDLSIGNSGTGTLDVLLGGLVSSRNGLLGADNLATGTVLVSGTDSQSGTPSQWTITENLTVGDQGQGTLTVSGGGVVSSGSATLADKNGSTGTVNVNGAGSQWSNTGVLVVGDLGNGTLNISDSGVVSSGSGTLGRAQNSSGQLVTGTGVVTVTGSGSEWNVDNALRVGQSGTGQLDILQGGAVTSGSAIIADQNNGGLNSDGRGTVNVDGDGSDWTVSGDLTVGNEGPGTLNVSNGAKVSNSGTAVIGEAGRGTGTVTVTGTDSVSGTNSTWTSSGDLTVGNEGTGTLNVSDGGQVSTDGAAILGQASGGVGAATVTGTDSRLEAATGLTVGDAGDGTLTLADGGVIRVGNASIPDGTITIAAQASSFSTLNIGDGRAPGLVQAGEITQGAGDATVNFAVTGGNYYFTHDGTATGAPVALTGGIKVNKGLNGTMILPQAAHVTGGIRISDGRLELTDGASVTSGANDSITLGLIDGLTGIFTHDSSGASSAGVISLGETTGSGGILNMIDGSMRVNEIFVGENSTGTLNIFGGARFEPRQTAIIGSSATGVGVVNLGGLGSLLSVGNDLTGTDATSLIIGDNGTGTIIVSDRAIGGSIRNAILGNASGSMGTLNVSGINAADGEGGFVFVENVIIGEAGTGIILVEDGGFVETRGAATLGNTATGQGTVTLTGTGSDWSVGEDMNAGEVSLIVGNAGTGTLSVTNGATFTNAQNAVLGQTSGITGTLNLLGSSTQGEIGGDLIIGQSGRGVINLDGGAQLQSLQTATVGEATSGVGEVQVAGSGSQWTVGGNLTTSDPGALTIGDAGTGTLNVSDNAIVNSARGITLGAASGSSGDATVSTGADFISVENLVVGQAGEGILNVQSGGIAETRGTATLGAVATTGVGTVTVTGGDSEWNVGANLTSGTTGMIIGDAGTGTLNVESGADAISQRSAIVGNASSGVGTVNVTGGTSRWGVGTSLDETITLTVGAEGAGTVNVSSGGFASSIVATLGQAAGSLGTVTVTGSGSIFTVSGGFGGTNPDTFFIGDAGTGTFTLVDSGRAQTFSATLGQAQGGSGTATVTGAGSTWEMFGDLFVGEAGTGTLTIADGGEIRDSNIASSIPGDAIITLGVDATGSGTLNIGNGGAAGILSVEEVTTGAGSGVVNFNHTDSDYFFTRDGTATGEAVALTGKLSLNHNGAGQTTLAEADFSVASLQVPNGTLMIAWNSTLGGDGTVSLGATAGQTGTLVYSSQGASSVGDILLGQNAGSEGILQVMDGMLQGTNVLVGDRGAGSLQVSNGGILDANSTQIADFTGSTGSVTVTGTGSQMLNSGDLTAGIFGNATVRIEAGGLVTSENGWIARRGISTSSVIVSGENSRWTNAGILTVGEFGTGSLLIEDGAAVTNTQGSIGARTGRGMVTLTGAGSTWELSGGLSVGSEGEGRLDVTAGGVLRTPDNTPARIGRLSGSIGVVRVSGAGSQWISGNQVEVGVDGEGTLILAEGGRVSVGNNRSIRMGSNSATPTNVSLLQIGEGGAAGIVDANAVDTAGTGTGTVSFNHSDSDYHFTRDGTTLGAAVLLSGALAINHTGSGQTTLTGPNTYTGGTTISAGTLRFNGGGIGNGPLGTGVVTVESGGTLAGAGIVIGTTTVSGTLSPGNSAGAIRFRSDLVLESTATTFIEIESVTSFDQIEVDGNIAYGGELLIGFLGGYIPVIGDSFQIFDAPNVIGGMTFTDVKFQQSGFGGTFDALTGSLDITAVPESAATWLIALGSVLALLRRRLRC